MPHPSTSHRLSLAVAAGLLAAPLLGGTAVAAVGMQSGSSAQMNQTMQAPQHVAPATINKAGKALRQVLQINRSYGAKMSSTTTAAQKQKLVAAAKDKATMAITHEGLSVQQYNEVLAAAQKDPAIRAQLLSAAGLHARK